jgi:thioredoxin reductase
MILTTATSFRSNTSCNVPGVFAVGDVRFGSTKRVATAVGAGSIAIQFAHQFLAARGRSL